MSSKICYKITIIVCKDRKKTTTKTMIPSITKDHKYKDYGNKYNKLSKTHRLSWSLHLKFCDAVKELLEEMFLYKNKGIMKSEKINKLIYYPGLCTNTNTNKHEVQKHLTDDAETIMRSKLQENSNCN